MRPNIAIVRDSGTSQTIINDRIVHNGSTVPISRNIVKNMEHVESHIARVKMFFVSFSEIERTKKSTEFP